jgi:uncharacterized protein (TIGR03663 family)
MSVAERSLSTAAAPRVDRTTSDRLAGVLQRPLLGVLPIDVEKAAYVGVLLVAALLRFWDLGPRMLHHDESLHATYTWYLYTGKGYVHDPMMHGPFLFEFGALMFFLFGATDAVSRVGTALFGVLLVGLVYLTRDFIGRGAALAAAVLMAVAPSIVYYSRFDRHDIYLAVFQFAFLLGIFRYLRWRRTADLWLVVTALSLAFSTKEDTFLQIAYLAPFLVFLCRKELGEIGKLVLSSIGLSDGPKQLSAAADVAILIGTLTIPLVSGGLEFLLLRTQTSVDTANTLLVGTFAVLAVAGAIVGLRWNARIWVTAAIVFWGIFIALYTTFFSNPGGLFTGAIGGLKYWIDQQGVARGNQPWYYYLLLLPLYEFVAVIFGIGGAVYLLRRRTLFGVFLVYWAVGALLFYGWAAEKMPWMVIHMAIPFVMLAGVAVARLIEQVNRAVPPLTDNGPPLRQYGLFVLMLFLAGAALISGVSRLAAAGGPLAIAQTVSAGARPDTTALFQAFALLAAAGVLVYAATNTSRFFGRALSAKVAALGALAFVLMPLSLRAMWQVNFFHGDVPVEMLVYTQTTPDVGKVMDEINRVAFRTGTDPSTVKVVYDSGVSWPFVWYLRDYKNTVFIGGGQVPANAMDAPIILVGLENNRDQAIKQQLGSKYVGQRYRLRWWFPEDSQTPALWLGYRSLTLSNLLSVVTDPSVRSAAWRYFMYRETPPLGSTDFMMFERKDLVSGAWAAPQSAASGGTAAEADADAYAKATKSIAAVQVIGGQAGKGDGQFNQPKGAAIGPDGSLYVVDTFNARVEKFDKDGKFLLAWGSEGQGDGQFKEPWGIAVGPNGDVYVADTWNHRIQRFDKDGRFKSKWGQQQMVGSTSDAPTNFFGPRGIAIDAAGSLLVTDTGNHRVLRFDADGKPMGVYGGRGSDPGQLSEPVGIAVDKGGNFYVADTWNHRVQKFDPNGRPVAQWAVPGWESESLVNKPYLAVDSDGSIYFTDPEGNRAVKLSAAGQVLAVWGKQGRDNSSFQLPTGIVTAADNTVYVVDSQNQRVLKFAPIR